MRYINAYNIIVSSVTITHECMRRLFMELGIIGLGHAFQKQYKAIQTNHYFSKIILCDKKKLFAIKDFRKLKCQNILISTSPNNHLEILKHFHNKNIILEKPMVKNLEELEELKKLTTQNHIYSSLHFAYGKEIDFFLTHLKSLGKPEKIYCYISDKYIKNNHILKNQLGLGGAYLDETINPLSACCRIFGYDVKFIDVEKKTYPGDDYDYYAISNFTLNKIPLQIEVNWNTTHNDKFIQLFYKDKTITLDSMKQQVCIDDKIVYQENGNRMFHHYFGVWKDFINGEDNIENSIKMHEEVLKGV